MDYYLKHKEDDQGKIIEAHAVEPQRRGGRTMLIVAGEDEHSHMWNVWHWDGQSTKVNFEVEALERIDDYIYETYGKARLVEEPRARK